MTKLGDLTESLAVLFPWLHWVLVVTQHYRTHQEHQCCRSCFVLWCVSVSNFSLWCGSRSGSGCLNVSGSVTLRNTDTAIEYAHPSHLHFTSPPLSSPQSWSSVWYIDFPDPENPEEKKKCKSKSGCSTTNTDTRTESSRLFQIEFYPALRIRIRIRFGRLDPDPHWEYGSWSRRAKINHKSEENSSLKCWMFFFWGMKTSPVAWTSFMEA